MVMNSITIPSSPLDDAISGEEGISLGRDNGKFDSENL